MRQYTITTEVEVKFRFPGLAEGETETAYPTLAITYHFYPAQPAHTPRGEYGPIDPPVDAEVEFISAKLIEGDGMTPTASQINEWAEEWLASDTGYHMAASHAVEMSQPDPDEAYERARDNA